MKGYKVIFENNIPVFARMLDVAENQDMVRLSKQGSKRLMNWLVVYGDNETDAMEIARKVMQTIWAEYLG